jgi:ATP-dependent DNA ligase
MYRKGMIQAEKLQPFDPKRFQRGFVSAKHNGIHGIYDPSFGFIYSRTPSKIQGMEHIIDSLPHLDFPIVGELVIPDMSFEQASGKIRDFSVTPEARFIIFNCIIEDECFAERWKILQDICSDEWDSLKPWELIDYHSVTGMLEFDLRYIQALNQGHEGVCWISHEHIYQPNKRGWLWMKKTPVLSMEVKIIDVCSGTSGKKYEDSLGHFLCELPNGKRGKVGIFKGQTDAWRKNIWQNKDNYLDQEIVIEYKALSKYGIPVQPRFKAFRWDL